MDTLGRKLNKNRVSFQLIVAAIILSVSFFVMLTDMFKESKSSITVLVSAKSVVAAQQQQQTMNNLVELPRLLSFYDRMLRDNSDIRDVAEGKSPDERKRIWNDMLETEIINRDASVIRISITSKNQSDSEQLVRKATRTLFDLSGMYYDIKNDLDLRIIEGPVTHGTLSGWYWILPISIVLGILVSSILESILSAITRRIRRRTDLLPKKEYFTFEKFPKSSDETKIGSLEDLYKLEQAEKSFFTSDKEAQRRKKSFLEKSEIKQESEKKNISKKISEEKYPDYPEVPSSMQKKAEAPGNLPIADEVEFPEKTNEEAEKNGLMKLDEKKKDDVSREPTNDEIKKRLNELLRGK